MQKAETQHAPPASELIVLLGHTNRADGELSADAISRCSKAVELLQAHSTAKVLPTGGYGKYFNESTESHGSHLRRYLTKMGIPSGQILMPAYCCSGTIQDAYVARKRFYDNKFTSIRVVTSDYHLPRAQMYFARIFPETEIKFESVPSNAPPGWQQRESQKIEEQKAEWVDIPLYEAGHDFPDSLYELVREEHSDYDKMSHNIIAGQFLLISFVATILLSSTFASGHMWQKQLIAAVALFVSNAIFGLYVRMSSWAVNARKIMEALECSWERPGMAMNCARRQEWEEPYIRANEQIIPKPPKFFRQFPLFINSINDRRRLHLEDIFGFIYAPGILGLRDTFLLINYAFSVGYIGIILSEPLTKALRWIWQQGIDTLMLYVSYPAG